MSPLIPTRRVEEFAAAVDGRAPGRHAAVSGLEELVALVESIRRVDSPPMRAGFLADLRADLLAEAERVLVPTPTPVPVGDVERRRGRRLAVAASTFVVAGSGVGLVTSSAYALPGEMLYPVKRGTERIDLLVHTDAGDDARILLGNAETRLEEVQGLLEQGGDVDELVAATLSDFSDDAAQGGELLLDSYEQTGETADLEILRGFAMSSAAMIAGLPSLPPSSSQALFEAATVVEALDSDAVAACPSCGDGDPEVDVGSDVVDASDIVAADELDPETGQGERPGPQSEPGSGDDGDQGDGSGEASGEATGEPSGVTTTDTPTASEPSATEAPGSDLPATELPQATSGTSDDTTDDTTDPSSPAPTTTTGEEPVELPDEPADVPDDDDPETTPTGEEPSPDPTEVPTDVPTDAPTDETPTATETPSLPQPDPTGS